MSTGTNISRKEPSALSAIMLPYTFETAAETLRKAKETRNFRDVPGAFAELRLACGENPALWQAWAEMLAGVYERGFTEAGIASHITTGDVLHELRAGSTKVAELMLNYWHSRKTVDPMVTIGKALTAPDAGAAFDHPSSGFFALKLASRLALAQPGGARLLLDAALGWLPAQARSSVLPSAEKRMELGRLFWHLPPNWQPYWEGVIDDVEAGKTVHWDSMDARRNLADLMKITPADWVGWEFFQKALPPVQWEEMEEYYKYRPASQGLWTEPPEKGWVQQKPDMPQSGPGESPVPRGPMPGKRKPSEAELWSLDDLDKPPPQKPADEYASTSTEPDQPPPSPKELTEKQKERAAAYKKRQAELLKHHQSGGFGHWWKQAKTGTKVSLALVILVALGVLAKVGMIVAGQLSREAKKGTAISKATNEAVPDSVYFERMKPILEQSTRLHIEFDNFLKSEVADQRDYIDSIELGRETFDSNLPFLVCALLHPKVPMDLKQKIIEKVEKVKPVTQAINMLGTAAIPGSPIYPAVTGIMVRLFHANQKDIPEEMAKELRKLDRQLRHGGE